MGGPPAWQGLGARPSPPRYWGATCLVGILMLAIVGSGLFALIAVSAGDIAREMAVGHAPPSVAVDGTVEVYPGVRVQLPPEWEPALVLPDGIEISRGDSTAHILVREEAGAIRSIRDYVQHTLVPDSSELSWTFPSQDDIGGRPGAHATYAGFFVEVEEQIDGRLAAVEASEWTVLVDAWGSAGAAPSQSDVDAILASVEVQGP